MSADELRIYLHELGLLQTDLAKICAVSSRTVYNWTAGRIPIPQAVRLLVLAMVEGQLSLHWIVSTLPDEGEA